MTTQRHLTPPFPVEGWFFIMSTQFQHTVIVANGDTSHGAAVDAILATAQFDKWAVIGADGGTDNALNLGLNPTVVIGDMDSIHPLTLVTLEVAGVEILRFPTAKDETDLELALWEAVRRDAEVIRIIGGIGDRVDQSFGNIHLLQMQILAGLDVRLVSGDQTIWVLDSGAHKLCGEIGDTISLLPLYETVTGITTTGLEYPLQNEILEAGPARGMSNVILSKNVSLTIATGKLLEPV